MGPMLMIDADRVLAESVATMCLARGVAVRTADTLCEGVRVMLAHPPSVVLVDAGLIRLPASDQARVFESVAPGVPVVVLLRPGTPRGEQVKFELQGFEVIAKPVEVGDLLGRVAAGARPAAFRPGAAAAARAGAACG